jgi:phosphomevalonate kinase
MILGEYAVLDGAPAWVLAVDHGVQCTFSDSERLVIETPGSDSRFVSPALTGAPPGLYRFEAAPPIKGPKRGLGSSAAAVVAAVAIADIARGEILNPASIRARARDIHRSVQGSGSGIDVTASTYGGLIRVTGDRVVQASIDLSPLCVIATGTPASTGTRVERYLQASNRAGFVERSTQIAEAFAHSPMTAIHEAQRLLSAMAGEVGIDYLTPKLHRIIDLAEQHGGAAKPSGAGGGDIAIAWVPDPDARSRFLNMCLLENLEPLALRPSPGVHLMEPHA